MPELTREQLLMAVISGKGPAYLRGVNLSSLDLSNAGWLVEADLRQADLSNSNLARVNLRGANLEKANMQSCNLAAANLEEADLSKAKLNVANLRAANLRNANLNETNLVGANLVRANLKEANLESADLEGANLQGANLWKARLNLANLRMANLRGANLHEAYLEGRITDQYAHSAKSSRRFKGFTGSVDGIELTDLIQIVCLSRSNILFRIESEEGAGTIQVGSGRIFHAQIGELKGEEALFQMLQWENGRFETMALESAGDTSIDKPVEQLIIELARQRDEKKPPTKLEGRKLMVKELRKHVPIPAYLSQDLLAVLCKEGKNIDPNDEIQIVDAFDSADTGEVLCSVLSDEDVFIAPLRNINLSINHPLYYQVVEYVKLIKERDDT